MPRRKQSLLEEWFAIASKLPWWIGFALAAFTYLVLHLIAAIAIAAPTGASLILVLAKGAAVILQYVVPFVFLAGALVSVLSRSSRRPGVSYKSRNYGSANVQGRQIEPRLPENDLYELYKSSGVNSPPPPNVWSIELLRSIDWKRFEEVCAEFFRMLGFRAVTQSHGPDGGIDITLYAANDPARVGAIVQCKQWTRQIGPKAMRELLGVMTDRRVSEGIFVTASSFNNDAMRLAVDNHIDPIDGINLLQQIHALTPAQRERLLKVATEGDYLTPTCASCGIKLVTRDNSKDKSKFWGCLNFPKCRYKLPL